jgi:hypothetical protein
MSFGLLSSTLLSSLVQIIVPHAFGVVNVLVSKHEKLAPFAAEIAALEAEVLAVLTGQKPAPSA